MFTRLDRRMAVLAQEIAKGPTLPRGFKREPDGKLAFVPELVAGYLSPKPQDKPKADTTASTLAASLSATEGAGLIGVKPDGKLVYTEALGYDASNVINGRKPTWEPIEQAPAAKPPFKVGDKVRVIRGSHKGMVGVVKHYPGEFYEGVILRMVHLADEQPCFYADELELIPDTAPTPDAEGWIAWAGGERPVGPDVRVDIRTKDGFEVNYVRAAGYGWRNGHLCAYRICPNQA